MLSYVVRERRSAIGAASDVGNGLIVYSEVRNAGQQLWLINADGTGARQLTTGDGFSDTGPSISPDGRTVTFTRTAGHGSAIFSIGIDGTALRQIAQSPAAKRSIVVARRLSDRVRTRPIRTERDLDHEPRRERRAAHPGNGHDRYREPHLVS